MKLIIVVHLSPKTWWGKLMTYNDKIIIFMSSFYTVFTNNLVSVTESFSYRLKLICIFLGNYQKGESAELSKSS